MLISEAVVQFSSVTGLWTLVDGTSPLPVRLTHFEGSCNGTETELTWTTSSEINNDYFILEKSVDGFYFSNVATITGAGNSNVMLTYSHIDYELNNQTAYYRLKQVDFNGDYEYSTMITISLCSDKTFISVYPNPFKDILNITFSDKNEEEYVIELTDYLGRTIIQETVYNDNGIYSINMSKITNKGVYFVTLKNGKQIVTKKIIKQ